MKQSTGSFRLSSFRKCFFDLKDNVAFLKIRILPLLICVEREDQVDPAFEEETLRKIKC